jgi:transposase InsO family protein
LIGKGFVDWRRDAASVARLSVGGAKLSDEIASSLHGYTHDVDYSVGSRIRVRLYSGKVVEAEITAITNQSTGRKLQIVYGNVIASINPAQFTEVLATTPRPPPTSYRESECISLRIQKIQTDNGSSFRPQFNWHLSDLRISHKHIPPGCPEVNGKVERSHKTDSEEFYQGRHFKHKRDFARKLKK